jgi:hypothetical protein
VHYTVTAAVISCSPCKRSGKTGQTKTFTAAYSVAVTAEDLVAKFVKLKETE